MCSNQWYGVQNTNAFSSALLWRIVYSSQFYCLTSGYFGALSIFTGKADAKDFAVFVFTGNAHFQWIWSDNLGSLDSAPPMAVREKHRLYNKFIYDIVICHSVNGFECFNQMDLWHRASKYFDTWWFFFHFSLSNWALCFLSGCQHWERAGYTGVCKGIVTQGNVWAHQEWWEYRVFYLIQHCPVPEQMEIVSVLLMYCKLLYFRQYQFLSNCEKRQFRQYVNSSFKDCQNVNLLLGPFLR